MSEIRYPRGSPRYTVRLSMEEHTRLQKYLGEKDLDASSVIRKALVILLDQEQQEGEKEKADRV